MKKVFFVVLVFFSISTVGLAQFELNITNYLISGDTTQVSGDTLNLPLDSVIIFMAEAENMDSSPFDYENATFNWYFGDGQTGQGDSVSHKYTEGGGYHVILTANDGAGNDTLTKIILQISLEPEFTETGTIEDSPFCKGQEIALKGFVRPKTWEFELPEKYTENDPVQVDNFPNPYQSSISHTCFAIGKMVDSVQMLESICLNIEHSSLDNLEIRLTCPSDSTVILKQNDTGGDTDLGIAIDNELNEAGTAYQYCWSLDPDYDTMGNESAGKDILPEGSYTPVDNLEKLVGCPLNGDWKLTVKDDKNQNNGFIFSWQLIFSDSITPPDWSFKNEYLVKAGVPGSWKGTEKPTIAGKQDTAYTGQAIANPDTYGSNMYTFLVEDDFGGNHDTIIFAEVQEPSFSPQPPVKEEAPAEITFTNETDWGTSFVWDVGIEQEEPIETQQTSYDYTYTEKGEYKVLFTVYTEDKQCFDTTSITVIIEVPESEFDIPNVFSPNVQDGFNDIFIIQPQNPDKELVDVMKEFEIRIYNKWGRVVWKAKNAAQAQEGWDGRVTNSDNSIVTPGVYYYVIKARGKDNIKHEKKGSMHIF